MGVLNSPTFSYFTKFCLFIVLEPTYYVAKENSNTIEDNVKSLN